MPTQSEIQQTILSAQLIAANKTEANRITLAGGALSAKWGFIRRITRLCIAVLRQYNLQDYTSTNFLIVYDKLVTAIGVDTTVNTIDPNFQNPAFTIGITTPFAPIDIVRSGNQLLDAGGGNWYLPFLDDNGNPFATSVIPIFITINGVELVGSTLDTTSPPAPPSRIYGFPNNDPTQVIVVTVLGATGSTPTPPPPTQPIKWGWFATDPYATIDTAIFLFSGTITPNAVSYTLPFGSSATGNYLAVAEDATNPVKISWLNTILNYGFIPDSVMQGPVVIGGERYYVTRIPMVLQSGQNNLTLTS